MGKITLTALVAVSVIASVSIIGGKPLSARQLDNRTLQASPLLMQAVKLQKPLGLDALVAYEKIKGQKFEQNIEFSNRWIRETLAFYDKRASPDYKRDVRSMIDGGGEHGLGMRFWLTDKKNVATWDKTVQRTIGDDGYARLIALNAAFPPGSEVYRITYGNDRKYDRNTNVMQLNGVRFRGVMDRPTFNLARNSTGDTAFIQMVKFGDSVRKQMFAFYQAYNEGKVKPQDVATFNTAYVKSGGCALANTATIDLSNRVFRYLNALNTMSKTLDSLGYKAM